MSVFIRAIKLYEEAGYDIRTGLNSYHFKGKGNLKYPFTYIVEKKRKVELLTGGISPIEVYLFENLSGFYEPKNIFIIGNAFGWSTIVCAVAFKKAKVIAIDAGIEGSDNMEGIKLTNEIAVNKELNCLAEYGFSPYITEKVIRKHFGDEKLDLVFIDGLHTNEQLVKDFIGVLPFCGDKTIYLFHDIINWNMTEGFYKIIKLLKNHEAKILYRTTSGMGVCFPHNVSKEVRLVFDSFAEDETYIESIKKSLKLVSKIKMFISKFIPNNIKQKIKRISR